MTIDDGWNGCVGGEVGRITVTFKTIGAAPNITRAHDFSLQSPFLSNSASTMGASNPRKSQSNRKRSANSPLPSHTKKLPKIVLKRAKYNTFQDPDAVGQESPEKSPKVEDDDMPAIVDVSNMIYTLSQSFMLEDEAIFEDSNIYKLGEFSFRQSDLLATRKFAKAAELGNFEIEWVSGQATVSRKGLPKGEWLKLPVEDDGSWQKVESFIKLWIEQLRKEIKVKWVVTYRRKPSTAAASLNDEGSEIKKVFNVKVMLILGISRTHSKAAP
jgi:hypothetical protein